jgi:hypothetical protein
MASKEILRMKKKMKLGWNDEFNDTDWIQVCGK